MSAVPAENGRRSAKLKLAVGAIGIVFGDIGTSPIYAFRETFVGPHKLAIDDLHILGVVSLIFWSMTIVVALQYVTILLRADNKGEGGTLALVAMLGRYIGKSRYNWLTVLLAVAALGALGLVVPTGSASPYVRYGLQDDAWLEYGPGSVQQRVERVQELGAILLGGVRPSTLGRAGRSAEHSRGSLAIADRLFAAEREPLLSIWF